MFYNSFLTRLTGHFQYTRPRKSVLQTDPRFGRYNCDMYGEQRESAEKRCQPEMDSDGEDFEEIISVRQSYRPVNIVYTSKIFFKRYVTIATTSNNL